MNTGVYKIKNLINKNIYIGSSASIGGVISRWKFHKSELLKNKHKNGHLQNAWNKYGERNFQFSILEFCNKKECLNREQYYMDLLKPEYNIYKVAGSPLGRIVSEQTKEKIRLKRKYQIISEETKKKISLFHKGKPKSKNHKNKVKSILWGECGILRSRPAGRFSGNYKFLNIKTNEEIICGKFELSNKYNIDRSFVCRMCNNKVNQCKGWVCLEKIK
jgi:group I intron endonuclease